MVYSIIYRIVKFFEGTKFGKQVSLGMCEILVCRIYSTIGTYALCSSCPVHPNCQIKTLPKLLSITILLWCAFFSPCQSLSGNGLTASEWVKSITSIIGGKGGGSETNAQASGVKVDQLSEAVEAAKLYASSRVNN